ncbi:LacI family DNA-binding transcriptional regulator [Staphylococcus agnetis]|uniref:LacI family DNA-binding transcriptional regulator n=1 Tax=Staphylococcus agnetis TaxID=985762 RepID=UPI0021D0E83A|nr:LacI family DNA-binding transcriptional regulator [Staphylococcus agnetis]UXU54887.1 LacI family DNA-binding transcriptional regulator [Staphylococcus agnetis]
MNIRDIAKLACVSKSTVSRYLNGGSISPTTRQKIDRVVQETGYSPNQFAQSLKAKRTQMMGVIVPRLSSYASNQTLYGIETYLRTQNYQTIIVNTDLDQQREIHAISTLAKNKVDGIILLATALTDAHLKAIQSIKVPIILVGQSYEGIHSIIQNDYDAGRLMGNYFGKRAFDRIAYFGVDERDEAVGVHRRRGVLDGLADFNQDATVHTTSFKLSDAQEGVKAFIHDYDAIICATDNIALGVLKTALDMNIDVPQTLSISGFGGYETTSIVTPRITTIVFPYEETGQCAAVSMMALLNGEEVPLLQRMDYAIDEKESVDILHN